MIICLDFSRYFASFAKEKEKQSFIFTRWLSNQIFLCLWNIYLHWNNITNISFNNSMAVLFIQCCFAVTWFWCCCCWCSRLMCKAAKFKYFCIFWFVLRGETKLLWNLCLSCQQLVCRPKGKIFLKKYLNTIMIKKFF